jgi:hypothetical protein
MENRLGLNATHRFVALSSIIWLLIFVLTSVRSSAQEPYIYPAKGQSQAGQGSLRVLSVGRTADGLRS